MRIARVVSAIVVVLFQGKGDIVIAQFAQEKQFLLFFRIVLQRPHTHGAQNSVALSNRLPK
jgi:hypothetical protein